MPTDVIIDPSTGQIYWNDSTGSPQSISIKGDAINAISFVGYSGSFSPGSTPSGASTLVTVNDNSGTDALVPGTSGFNLGSSTLRWNTFATNANLSGTLVVSDSTISSSLLTGSVRFNGGIAISGNASIGQSLNFYNTSNANYVGFKAGATAANTLYTLPTNFPGAGTSLLQSDTSGTLTWVGAVGAATTAANINVVSASTSANHPVLFTPATGTASGAAVSSNSTLVYNPSTDILNVSGLAITSGTVSTSTTSGAFQVKGGIGITGNAFIGGTINLGSPLSIPNGGTNASSFGQSAGFIYYDGANVRLLAASGATINYSNGYYQFDNRVYATSFFAGGSQMPNGSGIAGRVTIWSGNNTIGSDADFTYDTTNNILNVSGNINAIGFTASGVAITSGTASTSTTTGALVVAGGVGISGRLTFNQASFGTTGITTVPTMAMIGQTGDPIFMSVLEDNSISFEGSQGQLFSITPNLTTGYIWAVNDISGVPLLRASSGGTVYISEFGGVLGIGQTNPTYKLDLKGSFGLASSNDAAYNFIFSNSAASGSNNLQIRSANSILFYNSGNSFYTGFKSNASANKTYVLPATDGSSGQFLQTDGNQNLSWATATGGGGGSGATGVNPGGQYQIGYYASTGASIDGSSTFTNNTSTGVVSIGHATVSTNFGNGALTVTGGVGIGGSLYVGGTGSSISGVRIASGAITVGAWNGTVIGVQYGGTGQNLTGLSGILTISGGTVSNSTTSSAIASALSDETGSGSLVFATGPALVTPDIGAATGTSLYLSAVSPSTSTTTGALRVPGGVGIGLSVSIGGRLQLFNGANFTAFVSSASGNTIYTLPDTSPAVGSSVLQSTSTGIMSWVPMVASGGAGSGTVAIPGAQYQIAAYYWSATGASVSGSSTFTNNTGTAQVAITHNTASTSTSSGALAVSGGLGLAGNAFIGGTINVPSTSTSNISNILFSNGIITSGSWSGSTITAFYGGTGLQGPTAIGDIIVANTTSTWSRYAASSNTGYVLTSNGSNAAPTWQAVPPAAASSVAVTPTILAQSFFITTVSASSGTGLGLSTITSFVVNPSTHIVSVSGLAVTNTTASTSTGSGALIVSGGFGLAGNAFIGGTAYVPSTTPSNFSNLLVSNNTASTSTGSGALVVSGGLGIAGNAFIGGTIYVPSTTASNFSNLLVSNNTSSTSTSSGALVVNGGLGIAGNAFIGGTFVHQNSTSSIGTNSGAITVAGGVGIAGNAFIGGTTTIQSTQATTSTNSGALVVSGGLGIAGNAFIGGTIYVPSTTPSNYSNLLISNNTSSSSTSSGALVVSGGLGLAGNAFIGGTVNITNTTASGTTNSGALVISGGAAVGQTLSVGGSVNVFNGANFTGFRFAGSANTTYTLPPRTPTGTGTSYLSSSIDGVMAWVAAPTSGGSATPGGSNNQIQYNSSNTFAGASGFEYTTAGNAITVSMYSPSGTGITAGLWVHAINGTTTRVGIGLSNPAYELEILGEISATNKSFVIDHPTKDGMKLRYGSLEGPENGVYVRGKLNNSNIIEVPDHWLGLVHPDSYTVHLTPIGRYAQLYVEKIENYNVYVADANMNPIHCYYSVWAERKDIPKLITEYEAQ
jgi:hypothetical protein